MKRFMSLLVQIVLVAACLGIAACANPASPSKPPESTPGTETPAPETPKHVLRFNANGGSGTMESMALAEGETVTLPPNSFVRDTYVHIGWVRKRFASTVDLADGAQFIMGTGDVTLYAVWLKDISKQSPILNTPFDKTGAVRLTPSLYWIPLDGATSYDLYLSTEASAGETPRACDLKGAPYEVEESLLANTTFYWKVVAKNSRFESLPSETHRFTTDKDGGFAAPVYTSPENHASVYPMGDFAWQPVSGATMYRFRVWPDGDTTWGPNYDVGSRTSQDSFAFFYWPGYTWNWKVIAENATASSRDTSEVWSFTPSSTGIAAPQNITIDGEYNITWDTVPGAVKYVVLLNYGGKNFTYKSLGLPRNSPFNAGWLSKNKEIGFTVMALDADANTSYTESIAKAQTFVIQ